MLSFLKKPAFLLLLAFLLIAVFIWYLGGYFAFGLWRPLESDLSRLIAIVLVGVVWLSLFVVKKLKARKASDKLVSAVLEQSPSEPKPSGDVVKLRERFEEAVGTLKQQQKKGSPNLYELPWYVIIGAPGSGKTTALVNSGLKFPLESKVGKGALRGVGGTRNCDWWFTDQAVFLDTAGRYTTQDSDASSDSAGWSEFLALLRKYRVRRPLNGVILTISAQELMTLSESAREAHIESARQRLRELSRELQIQLPVYLMVTKCDLVAGFTEYFDDLTQEQRAQVWGVTFPYEQSQDDTATQAFPAEFESLIERLNARLFARIEEGRDVRRRTKVFAFPQQMAALRDLLALFATEVFSGVRFDHPVMLRGVYFTSGTQEGTPIDRLLGAIGRRFGVSAEAVAPAPGRGKAYFMERLLKDVMIGESGLAGVNRKLETKQAALQLGAYAAVAVITVVGILLFSWSYGRNRSYISDVGAEVAALHNVPVVRSNAPVEALLTRLNAVRAVSDSANRYRDDTPWGMRWGLYQGRSLGNAARDAYLRELDGLLLPRFAAQMRRRVAQYASEPDKLYEYLKAYVMLGEPRHLDKGHLSALAELEWNATAAGGGAQGLSLAKHFQSLLEYSDTLRPTSMDPVLVAQARATVRQASVPKIMYSRIKSQYADDTHGVRLDAAGGLSVDKVLKRKSGASLSQPVPALYSAAVFKDVTKRGTAELIKDLTADNWVWGDAAPSVDKSVRVAGDVFNLYEQDYIVTWDNVLADVELVPFTSIDQTIEMLGLLAAPTSPLRGLLKAVDDNTYLVESTDGAAEAGAIASATNAAKQKLGRLFNQAEKALGTSTGLPGALVTAHYQSLHQFVAGGIGSAPVDKILAKFGQIQQQLKTLGPDIGGQTPVEALKNPAVRDLLAGLNQEAEGLPVLVGKLVKEISSGAGGVVKGNAAKELEDQYRKDVLSECRASVQGRYPFATSSEEVALNDFAQVFGPMGLFDTFFKMRLEDLIDTSRTPWAPRPGGVELPSAMLARFELAQEVREMFFPSGTTPRVGFTLTLSDLDATADRFVLQIDGTVFADKHYNPPQKRAMTWPASQPGMAAVTFEDRAGAGPTNGKQGTWAWFRLIDDGRPQIEGDRRIVLTYQAGGHRARATIEPTSVHNPFVDRDWQHFSCGS